MAETAPEFIIVGNGGREHAALAVIHEPDTDGQFFVTRGNAGMVAMDGVEDLQVAPGNTGSILEYALTMHDPTVVVGPESPLIDGMADRLRAEGIQVFGASAEAAKLEGSKLYSAWFMDKYEIPHARSEGVFDIDAAASLIDTYGAENIVIKADGEAGGKGVVLPRSRQEAIGACYDMLLAGAYGGAGTNGILISERLSGPEFSVFAVVDGNDFSIIPMATQDHKRLLDGDQGPNTGGMGAYSPVPAEMFSEEQWQQVHEVVGKTAEGMVEEGKPFNGILYLGLMASDKHDGQLQMIEYNIRLGDPEAQVLLPAMQQAGVDMRGLFYDVARGTVPDLSRTQFTGRAALTVCLAAGGYPDAPKKGSTIYGADQPYDNVQIFHGGTARDKNGIVTVNGGRVLYVTGQGESVDQAAIAAYAAIGSEGVHFDGMHYRTDIGWRARTPSQ